MKKLGVAPDALGILGGLASKASLGIIHHASFEGNIRDISDTNGLIPCRYPTWPTIDDRLVETLAPSPISTPATRTLQNSLGAIPSP